MDAKQGSLSGRTETTLTVQLQQPASVGSVNAYGRPQRSSCTATATAR